MPISDRVVKSATAELDAKLDELHREHEKVLKKIATDPKRYGNHLRSHTHGRAVLDQICHTYRLRRDAIDEALVRALRFQDDEPFTVDELVKTLDGFFEPQRSKVLEQSRQRLIDTKNGGDSIDATTADAQRQLAAFRARAEHIVADHAARDRSEDEKPPAPAPQAITGTGELGLSGVGMVAFGSTHTKAAMDVAAESTRELERLHKIVRTLSRAELSAYATRALPIRTFLISKGHAFSVLPEEMLAEQFRQELDRRMRIFGSVIAIATLVIGGATLVKCSADTPPSTTQSPQVVAPTVTVAPAPVAAPTTNEPVHAATPATKEPAQAVTPPKS